MLPHRRPESNFDYGPEWTLLDEATVKISVWKALPIKDGGRADGARDSANLPLGAGQSEESEILPDQV